MDDPAVEPGRQAFQAGDYERAVFLFKQARWKMPDGESLKKMDHWIELSRTQACIGLMKQARAFYDQGQDEAMLTILEKLAEIGPVGEQADETAELTAMLLELRQEQANNRRYFRWALIGGGLFVLVLIYGWKP